MTATRSAIPAYNRRMVLVLIVLFLLVNPFTFRAAVHWYVGFLQGSQAFSFEMLYGSLDLGRKLKDIFMVPLFLLSFFQVGMLVYSIVPRSDLREKPAYRPLLNGGYFVLGVVFYLGQNQFMAGRWSVVRVLILLVLGWFLLRTFYFGVIRNPGVKKLGKNLGSVALGLLMVLLVCEAGFLFVAQSNQNNRTLASKVWFARHWKLNKWGYRDAGMEEKMKSSEKKLLLLGDSFTSGHGIENPDDRFGELLDVQLEGWQVMNLGMNGSEPDNELKRLEEWKGGGDLLVLVWFVNDIHEAAAQEWQSWEEYSNAPLTYLQRCRVSPLQGSYLYSYLYWLRPPVPEKSYRTFLEEAFAKEEVVNQHRYQLNSIFNAAKSREMRVAAVLFPFMEDVEGSEFAVRPVREFLAEDSIPTLDLRPVLLEKGPEDGRVNPSDPHPNEAVQLLVAEELERFLREKKLLEEQVPMDTSSVETTGTENE